MKWEVLREDSLESMRPHAYVVSSVMGAWDIRKYDGEDTWAIYTHFGASEPVSAGFESVEAAMAACSLMKGL